MLPNRSHRRLVLASLLFLAACGGGGGNDPAPASGTCSVAEQNSWLSTYFNDWYLYTRIAPHPDPAPYTSVASYFEALRYLGTDSSFPRDRWSGFQTTESFNRFFGDGATLGYGLAVAGVETDGDASRPLWVRYVDPGSPAAAAGVQRGDEVRSLNGVAAAGAVAARDFSVLTAGQAGQVLNLVLRRGGVDRNVALAAAVYNLAPVQGSVVLASGGGRRLAYISVKDMVSQALTPLQTAFAQFSAAGVQDLVLDLRYNGGGLVSTGATLASYIAGPRGSGLNYARLLFNDAHAATSNNSVPFSNPAGALGLRRVFVLTGSRTCSASEQVINGLRGAGLEVVGIGDTTCGKPVGFQPAANCGNTYSVVNFESVNQRGEGRYFDGLAATCPVAEDFTQPQGIATDPLLAAASTYADSGACPRAAPLRLRRGTAVDDGGRAGAGMLAR